MTRRKALPAAAVVLLVFIGFSFWYTMMCKADWDGVPVEAGKGDRLAAMADSLYADVHFLAETIGPRNPDHYAGLVRAADWIKE